MPVMCCTRERQSPPTFALKQKNKPRSGVMTKALSPPALQLGHAPRSWLLLSLRARPSFCAASLIFTYALTSWKSM
jgi:hypothetical protein